MSRSYKKNPFAAICGSTGGAKKDKNLAHRGERQANKRALKLALDFEDFLPPHRLECTHNEVWSWNRDGHQRYCAPSHRDWHDHLKALDPETHCLYPHMYDFYQEHDSVWPPAWYVRMMRK